MTSTFFYLQNYTDEVMPCRPSLDAWATWLAKPDPTWGRPTAAEDGAEFCAMTLDLLGEVTASMAEEGQRADTLAGWRISGAIPDATSEFYLYAFAGADGWDANFAGPTVDDALDDVDDPGPHRLACVKTGASMRVRFDAAGPSLLVIGPWIEAVADA